MQTLTLKLATFIANGCDSVIFVMIFFLWIFATGIHFFGLFVEGTSVCNGDSGGGMVFPKTSSSSSNPVWQLRGLVSISVALQNQLKCDSSHYVVFTDVAKYLDWIRASLD
jgi:secreted trypsin-like serine protease